MNPPINNQPRTNEEQGLTQRRRKRRIRWWLLAALFAVLCTLAPLFMQGKVGSVVWVTGMMACGATLGGMNHYRPWRFGLLLSFAFVFEAILIGGSSSIYDLLDKIRFGVTIAIPAFIGSYGGAFIRKLIRHHIHLTGEPENIRYWKAAVGFGTAAGILTIIANSAGEVPLPAMFLLFSAATAISYLKPERLWRWVVTMTPGLPVAVILRVIFDLSRNPASHDLYPLEIGIAVIYGVVPVLSGAIAGRLIKTGSISQPPTEYPSYSQDASS
ncbi:hypothetical protein KKC97_05215 [bacterium]|nr:hypothetical protein [bacterium]